MKVDNPDHLSARILTCAQHARLIHESLAAFSADMLAPGGTPHPDSIEALAHIADELADELMEIQNRYPGGAR